MCGVMGATRGVLDYYEVMPNNYNRIPVLNDAFHAQQPQPYICTPQPPLQVLGLLVGVNATPSTIYMRVCVNATPSNIHNVAGAWAACGRECNTVEHQTRVEAAGTQVGAGCVSRDMHAVDVT